VLAEEFESCNDLSSYNNILCAAASWAGNCTRFAAADTV